MIDDACQSSGTRYEADEADLAGGVALLDPDRGRAAAEVAGLEACEAEGLLMVATLITVLPLMFSILVICPTKQISNCVRYRLSRMRLPPDLALSESLIQTYHVGPFWQSASCYLHVEHPLRAFELPVL